MSQFRSLRLRTGERRTAPSRRLSAVRKVLFAFGTRPEAIKLAPVIKEMEREKKRFKVIICITGQHRKILDEVLDLFKIRPDYDLNIMKEDQTLFDINTRVLKGFENILTKCRPDLLIVQGDTTTAFASALAAFYEKVKIAHIEAGLRTYDKYAPFPEEINRRLISHLADFHFAPTQQARENLRREGIAAKDVIVTGNTVIDAIHLALRMYPEVSIPVLRKVRPENRIILVTAHRRENFGLPLNRICRALKMIIQRNWDVEIIYPVHPNPNVRIPVYQTLNKIERIHLIPPLGYLPFTHLMKKSYLILTDSGGIQEEAPGLGKPVLVLRNKTERPEAISAGTARLVGTDEEMIIQETERLLHSEREYQKMASVRNPFGDGRASQRILRFLARVIK